MKQFSLPIIRMEFETPLHISNEKSDYGKGSAYLHSDALIAAIYFAWAKLGKPEWISDKETKPGFTMSSLFPYASVENSEEKIYFFPRPMLRLKNEETDIETKLRKKLKKVQFIDSAIFKKILSGEAVSAGDGNISEKFRSIYNLPGNIIESKIVPRASVSRSGMEDTQIFYMERHYFSQGCGLFAVAQFDSTEIEKRVKIALNFLGEEGLGTDRNIGNGKFKPRYGDTISFSIPDEVIYGVNLSLFCPSSKGELEEMMNGEQVSYNFIRRGGWLSEPYNTWRKKSIYMFTEGSVFNISSRTCASAFPVLGKMEDVKPGEVVPAISHPVWRNGRSIFIPF